jgi:hypothetical protein
MLKPTKWKVSLKSILLTVLSNELELESEGATLTSNNQAFNY